MQKVFLISALLLVVATVSVHSKCIDDPTAGDVTNFFKNVGCAIQEGAVKVKEGAVELGGHVKEGAGNFKDSTVEFGSDVKDKFGEIKEKLTPS